MAFPPIVALIGIIVIFITIDTIGKKRGVPFLSDIFILLYFLFAYINIDSQQALATFYLFGAFFVLLFKIVNSQFAVKSEQISNLGGISLKGAIPFLGIGLGILIFGIMRILQSTTTASIIGTPSLAISDPSFQLTTVMLLGIVETRMFFTVYNLLGRSKVLFSGIPFLTNIIGFLGVLFPVIAVSFLFAIFHLTAYFGAVSTIVFALLVMSMWLISFISTKSDLPANLSHMLWNGLITASALGIFAL